MSDVETYNVDISIFIPQLGFPGEVLETWLSECGTNPVANPQGGPGKYRAEVILGRPGHLPERNVLDPNALPFDGNSFIKLAKHKGERRPKDLHKITLATVIGKVELLPNDDGFAGKFISEEFMAQSFGQAELMINTIIIPLISGLAMYLDTPIHIETIRIKEVARSHLINA